jgi:two-component system cell cycle response regulator
MQTTSTTKEQASGDAENTFGSILVAEDSSIYRHLITAHLKEWGFDFECVKNGKEAWRLLVKQCGPTLALLDWVLPEIDGVELCRRLRARPENDRYTYTILLTSKNRKQEMLEAMEAGADDFLTKPFDPLELKARLLVGRRIVKLQQNLVCAKDALQFSASHDFLTGLWNRSEIAAFLQRELARSLRDRNHVGLLLVDIDHFKAINDQFGHEAGDCVLKEVARRFVGAVRQYDGVGRYGGEEFLLVMPGCDLSITLRRANEIRNLISSKSVSIASGKTTVTVSVGVAVTDSTANAEVLLRTADAALYKAKRNGRDRVETETS